MYGMTEACGRIAVLPTAEFAIRPSSVGRAVPHGELESLSSGEIVYHGPNVMLGYADRRADLILGDMLGGSLHTGDLGTFDCQGNLYITGRLNRTCKILGLRINLADVERHLMQVGEVAVTSDGRTIRIFHSTADETAVFASTDKLASRLGIPRAVFTVQKVHSIPRTDSGKILYTKLG
jgi:acyl-CoA synthetase (AMP-forming)/AMP-acid ligase II